MKKHELLKHAYDNYPKGTKFKNLFTKEIHTSTGKFKLTDFSVCEEESSIMLMQHSHGIWAEIVSDRKPLLVSEDGKSLFDGDSYFAVDLNEMRFYPSYDCGYKLDKTDNVILYIDQYKAFSTKQAAMQWIEEQKPKSVSLSNGMKAVVRNNKSILLTYEDGCHSIIQFSDIELMNKLVERELQNG